MRRTREKKRNGEREGERKREREAGDRPIERETIQNNREKRKEHDQVRRTTGGNGAESRL